MEQSSRPSGIPILGNVPWGTHICHFYQSPDDLLDLLVPYFKAGLENDEFCVWVTAGPLPCARAEAALRAVVRDFDSRLACGQIVIIPAEASYLSGGGFDSDRMLDNWIRKVTDPKIHGFCGARASGDTWWLERAGWYEFQKYERLLDVAVSVSRTLIVCTYPLEKCGPDDITEVARNHGIALIRRNGTWEIIENPAPPRASQADR